MGKYTPKSLAGFMENPDQDRKALVTKMFDATGGKMIDFHIIRGAYDFVGLAEGTYEQALAVKFLAESSGAISDITTLESISVSGAAYLAKTIAASYKAPAD